MAVVVMAEAVDGIDDSRSTVPQLGLSAAATSALPVAGEGVCSSNAMRPSRTRERGVRREVRARSDTEGITCDILRSVDSDVFRSVATAVMTP
jgi:hypothetical protein